MSATHLTPPTLTLPTVRQLITELAATEDDLRALEEEVAAHLETEMEAALADPLPDPAFALEGVYADPPRALDTLAPYRDGEGGRDA